MKQKLQWICMLICLAALSQGYALTPRTGAIVFRGSYWETRNDWSPVLKTTEGADETVYVGGYGGWIDFYSRLNDQMLLLCGMGLGADVMVAEEFLARNEVKVNCVTPLVFGMRYDLLSLSRMTAMQPYVSMGAGPYWEHHVHVIETFMKDDVVRVQSNMRFGLFFGAGLFYRIGNSFALNCDMKYHLLDMDVNNDFSGLEVGIGFGFLWGSY